MFCSFQFLEGSGFTVSASGFGFWCCRDFRFISDGSPLGFRVLGVLPSFPFQVPKRIPGSGFRIRFACPVGSVSRSGVGKPKRKCPPEWKLKQNCKQKGNPNRKHKRKIRRKGNPKWKRTRKEMRSGVEMCLGHGLPKVGITRLGPAGHQGCKASHFGA